MSGLELRWLRGSRHPETGGGRSRPTLNRILKEELENKSLFAEGGGAHIRYGISPTQKVDWWFSIPVQDRPKVFYNPNFFENYIPNQTTWLTPKQKEELHQVAPNGGAPATTYARAIAGRLMVDLSYASSALEGNTYSWLDTEKLLREGIASAGKTTEETDMVLNHREAVDFIVGLFGTEAVYPFTGVDDRLVREVHALLSNNLVHDKFRGTIREQIVGIGGSSYAPETSPHTLKQQLQILTKKAQDITDPFEQSLFLMVSIPYLQPFIDVNKRTGRLCANIPLLANGLPPLSFLGMNKSNYTQGLLHFYELGDHRLIAKAWFEAYKQSAPSYASVVAMDEHKQGVARRNRTTIRQLARELGDAWNNENPQEPSTIPINSLTSDTHDDIRIVLMDYLKDFDEILSRPDGFTPEQTNGLLLLKAHLGSFKRKIKM